MLGSSGGIQRVEVDALPVGIRTVPFKTHKVVQVAAPGALLRRGGFKGGNSLIGAAGV
jgi:hypothetical protein